MDGKDQKVSVDMDKKKILGGTLISLKIIFIAIGVSFIFNAILSVVYWRPEPKSEEDKRDYCASKIKHIELALKQYAMDFSDCFPPANGAAGLEYLRKYEYLADYAVYICPSTQTAKGKGKQPLTEDIVDYVYVGGLNEKSAPNTPILYDKPGNHQDFGNVGTVDGAAKGIAGKDWMKEIRK